MAFGVTVTGFVIKPIETILEELGDDQKAAPALGADYDVSAQSPGGQINGTVATQLEEAWQVLQAIYSTIDPDKATGTGLGAVSSLSGTVRESATKSTVTATVNLNAGKTLSAGAVASVSGNPSARFVTLADATNGGGAPADVTVAMEAETAGPVVANAGTLTEIETPQTGWNSITNVLDATIGEDVETDEDLRVRREEELRRAGAAAVDAIKADLRAVDAVTSAEVFENYTDVTDGDGIPPHSIEALVLDGVDTDIAQAIWESRAGGINDHGSSSANATDIDGNTRSIDFTRPDEITIYLDVFVDIDASIYPVDGDTQIKASIAAWAQANLGVGDDVILSQLYPAIIGEDGIAGVLDVTLIEAGLAAAPTGTANIPIGTREIADIQTTNITVTTTP